MKKRILIIEDDPIWANIMAKYATDVNANYCIVSSPAEAIMVVDEWRPDVICLDMLLAGETGMALLQELQSHDDLASIPVVLCSSVPVEIKTVRAFGVRAILDKTRMTPSEVRKVLRGQCHDTE